VVILMVPWWLVIVALLIGVSFGIVLMALCVANTESTGKKWWEDDE